MSSILNDCKKIIGYEPAYTEFDIDLILFINTTIAYLGQIGVDTAIGYTISDNTNTWDEFMTGEYDFEPIKTYVTMKVKLHFDPPANSVLLQNLEKIVSEAESRISYQVDK